MNTLLDKMDHRTNYRDGTSKQASKVNNQLKSHDRTTGTASLKAILIDDASITWDLQQRVF